MTRNEMNGVATNFNLQVSLHRNSSTVWNWADGENDRMSIFVCQRDRRTRKHWPQYALRRCADREIFHSPTEFKFRYAAVIMSVN